MPEIVPDVSGVGEAAASIRPTTVEDFDLYREWLDGTKQAARIAAYEHGIRLLSDVLGGGGSDAVIVNRAVRLLDEQRAQQAMITGENVVK